MPKLDAKALLAAIAQRDTPQRHRARLVLGGLKPDAAIDVPELIAGLDSPDDDVVFWSAIGLSRLGERAAAALPRLVRLLDREPLFIREMAAEGLARIGPRDPAARAAVFGLLRHPDPSMRRDALRLCIDLPDHTPKELQAIAALARDPSPEVASWSATALRNIAARAHPAPPPPAAEEETEAGFDADEFFARLERTVRQKPTFRAGLTAMLKWRAHVQPHPDWAKVAKLTSAAETRAAKAWLTAAVTKEPCPFPVRGIYFPVVERVDARERDVTALTVALTGQYEPEDEEHLWAIGDLRHDPKRARFPGKGLQRAVELFHREDGLGGEGVYQYGLMYAALLVPTLLTPGLHRALGAPPEPIGVLVGWEDGDNLLLGQLTRTGFVPARTRKK
jgi:hypothetical protein